MSREMTKAQYIETIKELAPEYANDSSLWMKTAAQLKTIYASLMKKQYIIQNSSMKKTELLSTLRKVQTNEQKKADALAAAITFIKDNYVEVE